MIISKTPYRISFVGGGTDLRRYYQTGYGAVVSMAISKYLYVAVNKRFGRDIRLDYGQTEHISHVSQVEHDIIRACMEQVGIEKGIEITTIGEVPGGTGLGSSSTLTVGVLNALYAYAGLGLSPEELMDKACEIEIDLLGAPIGKQDQCAAAFGGLNYFRFNQDETVERQRLGLDPGQIQALEDKLCLFYIGPRQNAKDILTKQNNNTERNLALMDQMRDQADELRQAFLRGRPGDIMGRLLREGWQRKKQMAAGISNSHIDSLYERGLEAGAMGGKLLGAGGGGFLLFYCPQDKQGALRAALGLEEMTFQAAPYGSRIVYVD